jgi:hypothetical protein
MASKLTITHEPMYTVRPGEPAAPRLYTARLKCEEPERHRHVILTFWEGKPVGYFHKDSPAEAAHVSVMFRGPRDGVEYHNSFTLDEVKQLEAACHAIRQYARRVKA